MKWLATKPLPDRIIHLCARLAFRGIYFPQMKWRQWAQLILQNRATVLQVVSEALGRKFSLPRRGHESLPRAASVDPRPMSSEP
jgi:hypothetical protein